MDNDRIINLGEDLRNHVFEILDQEIEITGMDAGAVAKAVEDVFVKTLQGIMGDETAGYRVPKGWESI